jgi:hypothetical protein
MEAPMRIPALAVLTLVAVWTAAPARAQTYDPSSPVCMQVYNMQASYIECAYTSLAQCAASASGRNAMCVINPYPGPGASKPTERSSRQHRRVY